MGETTTDRTSTAFHEAGHAVVGLIYAFPLTLASVVSDDDSAGHVLNSWGEYCREQSVDACSTCSRPTCEPIQLTPEGAQFMIAGVCAEALNALPAADDAMVLDRATQYFIHGAGQADSNGLGGLLFDEDGLTIAFDAALQLLRANWSLVEALAEALLVNNTLDHSQLRDLYGQIHST